MYCNLVRLIRGTLYAFRTPCQDHDLKLSVSLADLDATLESEVHELREMKLGQTKPDGTITQAQVKVDPYRLRQVIANFVSNGHTNETHALALELELELVQSVK